MIDSNRGNAAINVAGAFVAAGLVSTLGFMTWALVFVAIPGPNKDALALLIGVLSSNVAMVVGFFFGSSASSRQQQSTIDTLARGASANSAGPDVLSVPTGGKATVTATDDGTEIKQGS